jgi:hypothetical protein
MIEEIEILPHALNIWIFLDSLVILELWIDIAHNFGDLWSHTTLGAQSCMRDLVLNKSLKHGHAQVVLGVKLMHGGARSELLMISDQYDMLGLAR